MLILGYLILRIDVWNNNKRKSSLKKNERAKMKLNKVHELIKRSFYKRETRGLEIKFKFLLSLYHFYNFYLFIILFQFLKKNILRGKSKEKDVVLYFAKRIVDFNL